MSFDIRLTFKGSGQDSDKTLLLTNEAADKDRVLLAIIGPNSQQATFRMDAVDLLVGLRSIYPDIIRLPQ